jgi:WS/DGAT/MGAT family acyltransferase
MKDLLGQALHRSSQTPINGELGPHRRLEWLTMPLGDVRDLRRVLGCTVNDVVLATVTGAMRRYLFRRRVDHRRIQFRVAAPVNTRRPEHDSRQGNHVATWVIPLPLGLDDPLEQVRAIKRETEARKRSDSALAVDTITRLAEWLPAPLLSRGLARMQGTGPVNMVVTNVPGPQMPLYMLGAKLLALYPLVPLMPGGGLGVALFSYDGKLCWGFSSDYELVPDLQDFVADIRESFEQLRHAAVAHFMERRTAEPESHATELMEFEAPAAPERVASRSREQHSAEPIEVQIPSPPTVESIHVASNLEGNGELRSPGP